MKFRMGLTLMAFALSSLVLVVTFGDTTALAGKRPAAVPLLASLGAPDSVDMIRSDTGYAYEDGVDGVTAAFNPSTNDLILRMPSDSPRWISFDFSSPFEGYPDFGVSRGLDIVVAGIYDMQPNEERWAVANMNAGLVGGVPGTVRFGTLPSETAGNNESVPVYAKRVDGSWLVSTRVNLDADGVETGDKARLSRSSSTGRKGVSTVSYHHMSFRLTATLKQPCKDGVTATSVPLQCGTLVTVTVTRL